MIEDGVVIRFAADEFILTSAEPNLAYFQKPHRATTRSRSPTCRPTTHRWPCRARGRARSWRCSIRRSRTLGFFHHGPAKIGNVPVHVSRTGYTGDLGYELWVGADGAIEMWDTLHEACTGRGVLPVGQSALLMTRIEAGLVLIGVDFHSSRFAFNDEECSTPVELGFAWMFRDLATSTRRFIGRAAIERELADKTSRWKMCRADHRLARLGSPLRRRRLDPSQGRDARRVRDDAVRRRRQPRRLHDQLHVLADAATPHRHGPCAPDLAKPGSRVNLEITINHRYHTVAAVVARPPLFNPPRKTA